MFKKPKKQEKLVRMLIQGGPKVGKTWFGLEAGKYLAKGKEVAYLGSHGGANAYIGHPEIPEFGVLDTRSLDDVDRAIQFLGRPGHNFGVLVVDMVTDWYELIKNVYFTRDPETGRESISRRDWFPLKARHLDRIIRAFNLPLHVFLIAAEKPKMEDRRGNSVFVGYEADGCPGDCYVVDTWVRMYTDRGNRFFEVFGDRLGKAQQGERIENPSPKLWLEGVSANAVGSQIQATVTFDQLKSWLMVCISDDERQGLFEQCRGTIDQLTKDQKAELRKVWNAGSGHASNANKDKKREAS